MSYKDWLNLYDIIMVLSITGHSSCVYQYNVHPKSFYSCNPSLCNCSLELECSVTMPTEVAGNIAVQWYYLDTVTGQVQTINKHNVVEKWIDNVISTKLQLINLNDTDSFTSYWCSIVDPEYNIATSNVMQLHSDHTMQSCRSAMSGYSLINTTCAVSYYQVNKLFKSNIKPIITSCLCVLLVVLVFLWIVVLYKKTKTRNGMFI